jgi:hypothetical protein
MIFSSFGADSADQLRAVSEDNRLTGVDRQSKQGQLRHGSQLRQRLQSDIDYPILTKNLHRNYHRKSTVDSIQAATFVLQHSIAILGLNTFSPGFIT